MLDVLLAAVGLLAVVIAGLSARLERALISPPLLALGVGVLLGPRVLDAVSLSRMADGGVLHTTARLLLAVALMSIALRYPVQRLRPRVPGVALLLGLVLPGMAVVMSGAGTWLLGLPLATAAVLGAALSPTDPVLASSVVTGEPAEQDLPERLRQLLSIESGSNDGLALPFVLVAVAVATNMSVLSELGRAVYEVVIAVVVGAALGWTAGRVLDAAREHDAITRQARLVFTLVLAFLALGATGLAGGDGLLAVFVAGLAYNVTVTREDREAEDQVDEALNEFLVLPLFVLFGAVVPWSGWGALGWGGVGFVAVMLFARRLPLVLALRRPLRLDVADALWLGWFGPVGVAALFYLTLAEEHGVTNPVVWAAGTLTVAASTIAHGITATPGRRLYIRLAKTGSHAR